MLDVLPVFCPGLRCKICLPVCLASKPHPKAKTYDLLPVSGAPSGAPSLKDVRFVAGVFAPGRAPDLRLQFFHVVAVPRYVAGVQVVPLGYV